jgi:hypothetical protein
MKTKDVQTTVIDCSYLGDVIKAVKPVAVSGNLVIL